MFPQVPKPVIRILKRTIAFDPRQRATIDELLESEIFADIRSKEAEFNCMPLEMDFEGDE